MECQLKMRTFKRKHAQIHTRSHTIRIQINAYTHFTHIGTLSFTVEDSDYRKRILNEIERRKPTQKEKKTNKQTTAEE